MELGNQPRKARIPISRWEVEGSSACILLLARRWEEKKRIAQHNIAVNCCWSSPAQPFLVSGPAGTHDYIFVRSKADKQTDIICAFHLYHKVGFPRAYRNGISRRSKRPEVWGRRPSSKHRILTPRRYGSSPEKISLFTVAMKASSHM
jgi:hypothetical protein